MKTIQKIGVMTSGGDSPGMNAAIRSVVKTAMHNEKEVIGIKRGYDGMIHGSFKKLKTSSVSNIIKLGGTILQTARSTEFMTKEGRQKAYDELISEKIDAVVAIGGNGTFTGANIFTREFDIPFIGIPGTIDNDLYGTDFTLGFDTAINTVVDAIDRLSDTADSHNRLFFVEVMGRDAGFIALYSGIAGAVEDILIPESPTDIDKLIKKLEKGYRSHKKSGIIIVAEGDDFGGAAEVAAKVKEVHPHYATRVTILGHIQRGGSPSCNDRVLGSRLGYAAVNALLEGKHSEMAGIINGKVHFTPFEKAIKHNQSMNKNMLKMAEVLSM